MTVIETPQIHIAVLDWLPTKVSGLTAEATPPGSDLPGQLPFAWVRVVGGPTRPLTDYPELEVDVFGGTFAQAYDVAVEIQQELLAAPHFMGGVVVETVVNPLRPHERPWAYTQVRRVGAIYELSVRRR